MPALSQDKALRRLHDTLCAHYRQQARDLPWRRSRDPWAIWVSEIMLQQTQVDTVVPRYGAFLRQFPTPQAMAAVSVEQVCAAWAGLGYYRRARALHAAAQVVVRDHDGRVPDTIDALLALPGVGRYTAGAIASIAFGAAAPVVDGNVVRVLSRLRMLPDNLDTASGRKVLWQLATDLVAAGAPGTAGTFNQALMDLGATVCRPKQPTCLLCPWRNACAAYQAQAIDKYPKITPARPATALSMVFAWRQDSAGLWLRQRDVHGLWAGMWEMPSGEGADGPKQLAAAGITLGAPLATVTHLLTHRRVTAVVHLATGTARAWRAYGATPVAQPLGAPLSTLARKAIVAAVAAMV